MGAIADFNKAIEIQPDLALAYYRRGIAKFELKDNQGALSDYNSAIKLNYSAYYNRGVANFNLNQRKNACSDWKRARELGDIDAIDFISKYCK